MNPVNKIYHSDLCPICHDDYKKNQDNECLILKCGHIFHEICIKEWSKQQSKCPMCQSKVFIPILMKDIVKEAMQQGIEGSKKAGKYTIKVTSLIMVYLMTQGTLNCLFPGRWPTTNEEVDAYINEHGVIFDLRQPEGYLKLGLTMLAITGTFSAYYIAKSLNQRRNQPIQEGLAKKIKYRPPAH